MGKSGQKITLDLSGSSAVLVGDDTTWSPKGLLSVLDALEAIQFCGTLLQLGHELAVGAYIGWWKQLFRAKSARIEQLKMYWVDAGWRTMDLLGFTVLNQSPHDVGRNLLEHLLGGGRGLCCRGDLLLVGDGCVCSRQSFHKNRRDALAMAFCASSTLNSLASCLKPFSRGSMRSRSASSKPDANAATMPTDVALLA